MYTYMNKKEAADAIAALMEEIARLKKEVALIMTSDWEESQAKTISKKDVKSLQESAPEFGVLHERGGKKIYAFLGENLIRKKVIPSESFRDGKEMLLQIGKAFTLNDLSRTTR